MARSTTSSQAGPEAFALEVTRLSGPAGGIPVTVWLPATGASASWVIHAPAFGEEMNKSRHMVAATARRLATAGRVVLVPDLTGTGESASRLDTATWTGWVEELTCLVDFARDRGASDVCLWGLRLGCLLAADAARSLPVPPQTLLLWQPVHKGAQQMAQFLRLLTAAAVTGGANATVSAQEARTGLDAGETVEIAGYPLPGNLYSDVCAVDLAAIALPSGIRVMLFEAVASAGRPLTPVARRQLDAWQALGVDCEGQVVPGDLFWSTQELGFAPALVDATAQAFDATPRSPQTETSDLSRKTQVPNDNRPEDTSIGMGITFGCAGVCLAGRIHRPAKPAALGVVIVVGGPQYRAGSHRQFLFLAQAAAAAGFTTLRFDYRGLGDSGGNLRGFVDIADDIRSAVDALQSEVPAVERVVLWGLCDAATAIAAYAASDARVAGLVLANPWVYSAAGAAKVRLKRYYARRLLTVDFWQKLGSGGVSLGGAVSGLVHSLRSAVGSSRSASAAGGGSARAGAIDTSDLVGSMARCLDACDRPVLLLLSGEDFTAEQFNEAATRDKRLSAALAAKTPGIVRLAAADHTFSRDSWRNRVADDTVRFLSELPR